MKLILMLFVSIPALALSTASADELADSVAKICGQETLNLKTCKAVSTEPVSFNKATTKKLLNTIEHSTDMWADSLFEGDVDSNFADFQYAVRALLKSPSGQVIAYSVHFSYAGWETSCAGDDYDRKKPGTYAKCKKGRIFQTILVSRDLSDYDVISDATLVLSK